MGALWFFLTLAASTSGRWWTAALWSVAAGFAAAQTVGAWQLEYRVASGDPAARVGDDELDAAWTTSAPLRWIAALAAATVPLAAGWGTGLAGVVLVALAVLCGVGQLVSGSRGAGAVTIGVLLPAIAASSVVIAVRVDLWAGLFLILAVSLFDAGSYLMGAEAAGRWEGPVAGMIGAARGHLHDGHDRPAALRPALGLADRRARRRRLRARPVGRVGVPAAHDGPGPGATSPRRVHPRRTRLRRLRLAARRLSDHPGQDFTSGRDLPM